MMNDRPQLNIDTSNSKPIEAFMHTTLRPILKQKNDRSIACLTTSFEEKKINLSQLKEQDIEILIEQSIQKDIALKNVLLGVIIGALTEDEFNFYGANKRELNKRIFSLIKERFVSQLELIRTN